MNRRDLSVPRWAFAVVCLLAVALRFVGLDWDGGRGFHPDERRIVFALEELSFQPLQLNPHFFAYGSFPIYVLRLWTEAAGALGLAAADFAGHLIAGRFLSAVVGVAMVAWVARLGTRLYGPRVGLFAALFLALAVLPIQHAHFITFDLHQSFLTLVTLERLVSYAQTRDRRTLLVAAAVCGLSFATKASSAPLLLPLAIAAIVVTPPSGGVGARIASLLLACFVAALSFTIAEPYAFLDPQFLSDIREQGAMVRAAGSVPYTIQYLGTRPYVDDLRQAFTWGLGPALGIAAGAGTIAAIGRSWRRPTIAEGVLLAFVLPYLAITGWFPVKFMRYLLPLYPLWCLYAARLLVGDDGYASRARQVALVTTVVATAVWAFSFAGIYGRPHPWVAGSQWFYRTIPNGAAVATPHWEEGFPVAVPEVGSVRYRNLELPLYEADGPAKTRLLARRLADAETVVFPSKRLYGAISNAPERYPDTNRFLELLFSGDLGYVLEATFASRPSFFGIEWNDDFADESFTVYDHPKTLVFRNHEHADAAEIERRLRSSVPSNPGSREAMLAAGTPMSPATAGLPGTVTSSLGATALWSIALGVAFLAGPRLLATFFPDAPAAALGGLGPIVAYLVFAWLTWLAASLRVAPFSGATALCAAGVVAAIGFRSRSVPRDGVAASVLFGTFLVFLAIRAFNPEIYWGEKPMDFSFLNSLYRATELPPPEPWMAGRIINYPYFGHFAVVALGKATGTASALSFNLGIAAIAAFSAAAAFGAGTAIAGTRAGGLVAAFLAVFAGNLAGPVELVSRRTISFDTFWATSRVIEGTINEFPLWSFLFADLHAHVMSIPVGLALLGFLVLSVRGSTARARLMLPFSFALGALGTTNTWSLPIYAGAVAAFGIVTAVLDRRPMRLVLALLAVVLSFAWFAPYWREFTPPQRNWGWEDAAAPLGRFLLIFGLFLAAWVVALEEHARRQGVPVVVRLLGALAVIASAAFSVRVGAVALAIATLAMAFASREPDRRSAWLFAGGAALLAAAADTIFLWDRMNTIFKFYIEMWLLLAVASAAWLSLLRDRGASASAEPVPIPASGWFRRLARHGFRLALSALVLASVSTAAIDLLATLRTQRVRGPRPTLDGRAYLTFHNASDAAAIDWLNRTIPGSPTLLEAHARPYEEFGRVSMNTGLPAVLGWEYHLSQRAHPWSDLHRRKSDVRSLFEETDRGVIAALLERTRVAIVYVGELERRTYSARGLAKFAEWKDVFHPLYRNAGVQVYAAVRNFHWSEQPPVVEAISVGSAELPPEEIRPQMPLGSLVEPRGIAVDGHGHVFVADFGNNRIQVFDDSLQALYAFGRRGAAEGEFRDPCGVAVGANGRVYVADTWNQRVQVFEHDGAFVGSWEAGFYGPRGITVASDGNVWVADTGNGRVIEFSPEGELRREWKKGTGAGEFMEPVGIAVGADGRIFIADPGAGRIGILSASGAWLGAWPVEGWKKEVYREPYLAVTSDGRVIASDPTGGRLLPFAANGRQLPPGPLPVGSVPTGVVFDATNKLVIADVRREHLTALDGMRFLETSR